MKVPRKLKTMCKGKRDRNMTTIEASILTNYFNAKCDKIMKIIDIDIKISLNNK